MNIKIAKTMLALCIVYILGFYVLKFIFPEYLLLTITDPNILTVGKFIESSVVCVEIYYFITRFITYYLFASASKGSFRLNWLQLVYILVAVALDGLISWFLPDLAVHTSISLMFLTALLCKGKFAYTTIAFIIHGFLSQFMFSIRGFETIFYTANIASYFVLSIECFVWMIIVGLIFYLKEKKDGKSSSTVHA